MTENAGTTTHGRLIRIEAEAVELYGILNIPDNAHGLVILIQGLDNISGNLRQSFIAISQLFNQNALATLLVDLFTTNERKLDEESGFFRANTDIMQQRLIGMADWLLQNEETQNLSIGYFGTGASGAAALVAAAERPDNVRAVVVAGGSIDMVQQYLSGIMAPTRLIAAEKDEAGVKMNQAGFDSLTMKEKSFEQVKDTSSLFENNDTLQEVARLAQGWFTHWLVRII
ncbi:MAG: alpha/beta hydrolase [Chloroflexi bacterium]|nr:alpha/beta hydrolase [Chloroflexota bacterium]